MRKIDFSRLMDLRVDYAFKLLFSRGEQRLLISLLNAVFESAGILRVIMELELIDPHLEKRSEDDKGSIIDMFARLDDGSLVLIEMHLYGIYNFKYKAVRSWARAYGTALTKGSKYSDQMPVICVSFVNGSVDGSDKIHKCCKILDIEDYTVFSDALELHFVNMKAFIKAVNAADGGQLETLLEKWLALITEKDIFDKDVVQRAIEEVEEISMALSTLTELSMSKLEWLAYQRRQDDIMSHAEEIAEKDMVIAEHEATIAEKDTALAEKDKKIIELLLRLGELE